MANLAQCEERVMENGSPLGWRLHRLGEVADFVNGYGFSSTEWGSEGRPIIRIQNLTGTSDTFNYFNGDIDERYCVRAGDLLISWSASLDAFIWMGPDAWLNQHIFKATNFNSEIDRHFLYYALRNNIHRIKEHTRGSTMKHVTRKTFLATEMLFPPLPEQKAIAHVLRTVQRAKEATEKVIEATRQLKASLMKHLFTYGPVRFDEADQVELKETEIGRIHETWALKPLGELIVTKGGKRLPKGHPFASEATPYPYIRIVDFEDNSVRLSDIRFITEEDRKKIERYIITKQDVYISIAGTTGIVGVVPDELDGANLTENAARLVLLEPNILRQWHLVYYLASEHGQAEISRRTTKTSQPKLALTRIKQIPTPLPSLQEQDDIVYAIKTVSAKLLAEKARLSSLEALFDTLLDHLMTGRTRLISTTNRGQGVA